MARLPQWSTPERRAQLVELFQKYGNQCLQGHDVCPDITHYIAWGPKLERRYTQRFVGDGASRTNSYVEAWTREHVRVEGPYLARLYNEFAEAAIESWKAEDRERRSYEWKLEQLQLNDGTYGKYGRAFDPVARDVYVNGRPEYYLVAMGVSPFTYKRVALIRIPSTFIHLFVEVGDARQEVSKNAKRKAKRYGKVTGLYNTIHQRCLEAVRDYWANRG